MLTYISHSAHYKEVLSQVHSVKPMLWIGTADIKDLYIEMGKEKKPFGALIGSELYVAPSVKEEKKLGKHCKGYRLTVLVKNYQGYRNLIKLVSNSWTDGLYMRPRTDHHDLEKYH